MKTTWRRRCEQIRRLAVGGLVMAAALVAGGVRYEAAAADLPTVDELLKQASKACDAMPELTAPPRNPREALSRHQCEMAWQKLALARAQTKDFEGAADALKHVNADPRFTAMTLYTLIVEATGDVPPLPESLKAIDEVKSQRHREVLAGVLMGRGNFKKAREQAAAMELERHSDLWLARVALEEGRDHAKHKRREEAVRCFSESLEKCNAIQSFPDRTRLINDICRGLIDLGPIDAAVRAVCDRFSDEVAAAEKRLAPPLAVDAWIRAGSLKLRIGDDAGARDCFAKAKSVYEARAPKIAPGSDKLETPWEESEMRLLMLKNSYEAFRDSGRAEPAKASLDKWIDGFDAVTFQESLSYLTPLLVATLIRADRFDEATKKMQRIAEPPQRLMAWRSAAEIVRENGTNAQREQLAEYLCEQFKESASAQISTISLALELYQASGNRPRMTECVEQAVKLSAGDGAGFHPLLANVMAECGMHERAYELIGEIKQPRDRALPLAELAYQLSKQKNAPQQ